MKVVILAGGLGTRLSEETTSRPKPMVEIGNRPMLWHIMKIYAAHGLCDFVVCCGYKSEVIKSYFANFVLQGADVTFDLKTGSAEVHHRELEPWTVTLVETGEATATGGRLKRVAEHVDDEDFAMTYGDAVSSVDIAALVAFHRRQGRVATVTAVRPPARFGALELSGTSVTRFSEKLASAESWINGGFFVLSPAVFDSIEGDRTCFEAEPLEGLAATGQLSAYRHGGFWHAMDTVRDRNALESLWASGAAPWKIW